MREEETMFETSFWVTYTEMNFSWFLLLTDVQLYLSKLFPAWSFLWSQLLIYVFSCFGWLRVFLIYSNIVSTEPTKVIWFVLYTSYLRRNNSCLHSCCWQLKWFSSRLTLITVQTIKDLFVSSSSLVQRAITILLSHCFPSGAGYKNENSFHLPHPRADVI